MFVTFDSDHVLKAYFDPDRQVLECVSSFGAMIGESLEIGRGFDLGVDEESVFRHLVLDLNQLEGDERVPPAARRPAGRQVRRARPLARRDAPPTSTIRSRAACGSPSTASTRSSGPAWVPTSSGWRSTTTRTSRRW